MNNWIETPLEQLADISSGGTPSRAIDDFWGGDIPWATPSDITRCKTNYLHDTREFITQKGLLSSSAKLLPTGTLLFTSRATIGEIKISTKQVSTNQGFKNLVPKECIDTNFLFYQIVNLKNEFVKYAAGSTFLEINRKDTGRVLISHPIDKNKQYKIGHILQTIDRTITHTEALIEKYQQIKAGLMHDLFTRGIGADGKLRPPRDKAPELYQESSIGWIPKEWDIETLKNTFGAKNIVNGPFGSDLLTSELKKEGVPVLYCQDIKPGFFDRISHSNVTSVKAAQLSFCNVHKNDILLAKVGSPPCDSCIYDEEVNAVVTQDVIRVRPSARHDSQFFSSWFNSSYGRRAIKKISIEGTRERVSLGDFKNLLIPLPNTLEQKEIGKKISQAQVVIAKEKINLQKLKNQKSGLMHDLLTGTVQVNIDPV